MSPKGCLAGKAVVVTGAGRGIGRAVALLAAAQGGRIVVNDLGASPTGAGSDSSPAHEVVAQIEAAGGEAVASLHSVAEWNSAEQIISTALEAFGRIDCVVNNAGILRDCIFHRMPPEDFEEVVRVHLFGSFFVARAAAPHFRKQQSGSFVHFTSASGLVGNLGQAGYAAAKLGIVGLSKSIALDMHRFGIRSNCVMPFAWSRLIGSLPEETPAQQQRVARFKSMDPEKIAPLTVFLCSELAREVTGQIFAARKNEVFLMSQSRPLRSVHRGEGWTPETLAEQMLSAFRPNFYPLERSADVFSWDPI